MPGHDNPPQRIPLIGLAASRDRIRLSAGTMAAAASALPNYEAGARVARPDWQPPSQEMIARLSDAALAGAASSFIAIVRPPPDCLAGLMSIRETCPQRPEPSTVGNINALNSAGMQAAAAALARLFGDETDSARALGIGINPPGLRTTTINGASGLHLGLHLDSWYQLPVERRNHAPARLCVNLGHEPRRLLFINLPISVVAQRLAQLEALPPQAGPTDLARRFMERFPDEPVIALEIAPGEAYIAPTENLIHDGCTEDMRSADICLTVLGRFRRPAP